MGTMSDYFRSFKEDGAKKTEGQTPSAPAVTVNEKSSSTKMSDYFRGLKRDSAVSYGDTSAFDANINNNGTVNRKRVQDLLGPMRESMGNYETIKEKQAEIEELEKIPEYVRTGETDANGRPKTEYIGTKAANQKRNAISTLEKEIENIKNSEALERYEQYAVGKTVKNSITKKLLATMGNMNGNDPSILGYSTFQGAFENGFVSQVSARDMTETQRHTYDVLYETAPYLADHYQNLIESDVRARTAEREIKQTKEVAKKYPVVGVAANVMGAVVSPLAFADNFVSMVKGEEYDPNGVWSVGARINQASAEGLTEDINNPVARGAANLGLGAVNFATHLPLGPAALPMMAAEAAGQTSYSARMDGASTQDAAALGLIAGVVEAATEKVPLDNLFKAAEGVGEAAAKEATAKAVRNAILSQMARGAFEEGTEELISEYANTIADNIIRGDDSEMMKYRDGLISKEHLTEEEANKKAFMQYYVMNPLAAYAGGAILGGTFRGGATALGNRGVIANINKKPKTQTVSYSFGVSQKDIDNYVEVAYGDADGKNEDYKKYAEVSERLADDVANEIDLSGYNHALRDNDIRHIRNSHGEKTAEKYPVTKQDIKNIPWIIENYDKVYAVSRKDGKKGLIYVKANNDGLIYYLEQITSVYGNEPLLINKQMIKTGIGDIPDLQGLEAAITKKQTVTEFLNDLKQAQQVYVQDVYQSQSADTIIPQSSDIVNSENDVGAEAAKAFSQYAQGVFEDIDNDTYKSELMSDPEIADAVSDMDVGEGDTFTPSDGVVKARDVHEDFRNTGKFIPDTPTQEFRKAEAAKAKNDIQRSGILAGASKADIRLAEIMSALTGRNVIFESDDYRINGYFDGDNTIFVNVDRADGIFAQVLAHELAHSVEGTKAYAGIVKAVRSFVEANTFTDDNGVTHDWNYYFTEAHAEQDEIYPKLTGKPFTDAMADAEVVAKVLQGFFADNAADAARTQVALDAWLAETVKTNKTGVTYMWYKLSQMAKRIRSDIKDIRARKAEGYDAAARERELMLRRIEDIRDRFGRALMEAKKAKKAAAKSGDAAYMMAGEKAVTANKLTLENAKAMLEAGAAPETVRKETGWFKGYDGKWRFEIDDSKIEIKELHLFNYLGDIISHPELFTAYPELKDMPVIFKKLDGADGQYNRDKGYIFGTIHIDESLMKSRERFKSTLIHEIQHAVQDYEGFASGASPEYWKKAKSTSDTSQKAVVRNELQQSIEFLEGLLESDPDMEDASFVEAELEEQRELLKDLDYTLYERTAGEIEARDTANRAALTSEQRKNTRPDIDRSDVVFAEGRVSYMSAKEYDSEIAGIKDQIRNSQDELNQMDVVYTGTVPSSVGNKQQGTKWAVEQLHKYGYQVDRQGFGRIEFSPNEINDAMDYLDTNEEKVAIVALYRVLKRGIQIGEHGDHKKRGKHTITFAAPVELNGMRGNMAVVVNMRNNKYYVHRILLPDGSAFKFDTNKNADQEPQRGVPKRSLANATRSASDNSISHPEQNVNTSGESFSYTPDSDYIGTMPINDAESANRKRALEMYRQLDAGKDIGNGKMDPAEYIYMQTGWAYDGLGNFVVDHEAPIYIDSSEQHRMANRRADHAEGVNNALRSENAGLREDVQRWKSRTAAAEDAAKRLARDWRLSKERKLSADYVPSRDQVRGIVSDLGDMLGGGFSDVQMREYTNRLLDIYDRMGHDGKLDLTNYTSEIVALIDDMQSVEFVNEDNKALADSVRPELQVPVFLSEKARGDFAEGYGKTAKAYRGKVNFVSKANGTPVDVRYMELSERFPNLFPADITNEADQAKKMLEVADRMREEGFTTRDRYSDVGAEPDVVRSDDLAKAIARIVEGYEKLETKPRTFADGLLRTLEYERREHKRELARMTEEERAKAEAKHNKEVERLLGEAEAAMEWETEYLKRHLSEAEGELKAIDDKAKADAEAKARRAHLRGKDIEDAAIKAAKADGSFTSIMTKLHERHTQLENELAKVQAQCDKYAKVKASQMSRDGGAYVKQLREHRDQLAEDLSNLTAYINKVYQRVKSIRTDEYVDMIISDGNLADWKDKKIPLSYQIETMRRNILDSKPKNRESKLADHIINDILDPIVDATAQAISVKNEIRDRVRKLDLSTKVRKGDTLSESQFVQALGEAQSNIEALDSGEGAFIYNKYGIPMREGMTADEWRGYLNRIIEENPSITKDESNMKRMRDAVKEFKDIYDQLFTIVNAARVRNGYAPVPYHRGYFPHYNNDTKQDGILSSLFEGLGFRQSEISEKLPTSINGLTATFRPGIRYMSNAKQRSLAGFAGELRVTGAVEGIDRYLETAADVAFMTDHIQNLRSLSDAIRYATTTDATKKRIEEINADDTLSRDEKRVRKDEIFANRTDATKYALNHLVPDIEEYANILSGKKSRYDRTPENLVGRSLYTTGRKFMSRVASNQIVLNVGSWITNTVPLTTGTAVMHYNMLTGLADTIKGAIADDGFAARSTFLTSRRGSDRLVKSGMDMASEIGGYGMTWVDQIVSEWLMRARVRQNMSKLGKGMSEAAAIAEADKFISGMMAQRTKAEMPTIFASQNPLAKMFTMYQLEVKNNLSFLFKDMPREYKDETVKLIVKMFAIFLLSRIYNDYYEELTGRRPSFDPLEMLNDLSGDLSGYKIASADDFFRGKFVEKSEKKNAIDAFTNLGKSAAQEIPFVGGLLGGGRVPISSAMPDWEALGRALKGTAGRFYGEDDPRSENAMGINNIIEELYNGLKPLLYYGAAPFGGGQLKKVVEGGVSLAQGGSYNYSTSGDPQLQYPMYTDEKDGIWNAAKAIVFGKTATTGGREWVEGGFGQLSAKRTQVYKELVSSGASQRESFEAVKAVGGAGSKQIDKARALLDLELDDDAKLILFSNIVTTAEKKIAAAQDSISRGVGIDAYLERLIDELEGANTGSDDVKESSKTETKAADSKYKFNIPKIEVPEVNVPKVNVPKVDVPKFKFDF